MRDTARRTLLALQQLQALNGSPPQVCQLHSYTHISEKYLRSALVLLERYQLVTLGKTGNATSITAKGKAKAAEWREDLAVAS